MWQYNYTNPDNELYHYGVAGMKWGVRRFARRDKNLREIGKRVDNEREKQAIQSKIDSMTKQLMAKQGKYKLSAEKVYNQSKAGKSKVDIALKKKKK